MTTVDKTAWEILNATADNAENLEQIYLQVCFEVSSESARGDQKALALRPVSEAPTLEEIVENIRSLAQEGLLVVQDDSGEPLPDLTDLSYVWRAWFAMSEQGRTAWASSKYAAAV